MSARKREHALHERLGTLRQLDGTGYYESLFTLVAEAFALDGRYCPSMAKHRRWQTDLR